MPSYVRPVLRASIVLSVLLSAACGDSPTPTSPTTATTAPTTPVAAPPIYTEEFVGVVPVSGSTFYSFSVTQYGTVNVTLRSVGGAFVPSTLTLGLAIGVPSAETCATTASVNTASGSTAQLTGAYAAGVYCVKVSDVGNLFAPAHVTVSIAFP